MSWPIVKFSEAVCPSGLFTDGDWVESKDQNPEGEVRLIQLADIGVGEFINKSNRFMTAESAEELRCSFLEAGDILVARMPDPIGRACIFPESMGKCVTVVDVCIVRPRSDRIDNRWLMHLINSDLFKSQINRHVTGTTRQRISRGNLAELEIPLPPLPEQKRIAAILDKADAIRRKRQQAIQLADDFVRAVFLEMFGDPVTNPKGWEESVLMDVADIRSGVTKGKKIDPLTAVTLPYMRVANVQDGYLSLDDVQEITVSPSDADKCKLAVGDILLTEGGDPDKLGRGHVWNNEIANCIHQNHIFSVRIKDQNVIRPEFLSAQIASQRGKRYFLKVGKQTTGIATINKTVLSEFEPFIPPIDIQDKYICLSKAMLSIKEKIPTQDSELFESLSQKAFSGRL